MANDNLKRKHELAIATLFSAYLGSRSVALTQLRNGDASRGEPDVVAESDDGPCGIEVADGWMSRDDARVTWTLARGQPDRRIVSSSGVEVHLSQLITGPDRQLADALQAQLESHCRRDYGMRTYLVLNGSHAPLTSAEDAPAILAALHVPSQSRRVGIFLALTRNFSYIREFFEVR